MTNHQSAGGLPRLSIAVVGVGAIGSTFAFHLARAGHTVAVVARPESARLRQLLRDQGIVTTVGERVAVAVGDRLDEQAAYDLVIVTTLAHQVDAVLPSLQRSNARCVHFMFNNFDAERLRTAVGAAQVSFGMPFVMAKLDGDGKLDATTSASRKTLHDDPRWVALFSDAGLPSTHEPDMPLWLRCHVPLCVALESLAFRAQQRGSGASWAEAMVVARGLHGGFHIVERLGSRLYPTAKRLLNRTPNPLLACVLMLLSRNRPFRELLATGVHECRALIQVLTEAASGAESISAETIQSVMEMTPAVSCRQALLG